MKQLIICMGFILLSGFGCKGPAGMTGSTGPTGPSGPTGYDYQMTFENGVYPDSAYSGVDVHWINSAAQTVVEGTGAIEVGTSSSISNVQLGLVRVSLAPLPANATILSAQLQLTTETGSTLSNGTYVLGVYQFLAIGDSQWDDYATWLSPQLGGGWLAGSGTAPISFGYNYASTPLDSVTVTASQINGNQVALAWNIPVSIASPWMTETTSPSNFNYGLLLSTVPETGSGSGTIPFWDNTGSALVKPQIVVDYTIP
jgi:hypothetical protein